jgi:uncharacterized membrane protein YuzA (DUF378 family)
MAKLNVLDWVALVLVIIGGLNWGLVAIGGYSWDLVAMLSVTWLVKLVYALVGLSAIYTIYIVKKVTSAPAVM